MNIRFNRIAALMTALLLSSAGAASQTTNVEQGRTAYNRWCLSCHGAGQHTPGTMALFFKYEGKLPPLLEQRGDLTPEYLQVFIRKGISVMPSFRKTEVSDADIADIAAYLKDSAARVPKTTLKP